jgi:hypothetical protein
MAMQMAAMFQAMVYKYGILFQRQMTTLLGNTAQDSFLISQTPLSNTFKMCIRSIKYIFPFY